MGEGKQGVSKHCRLQAACSDPTCDIQKQSVMLDIVHLIQVPHQRLVCSALSITGDSDRKVGDGGTISNLWEGTGTFPKLSPVCSPKYILEKQRSPPTNIPIATARTVNCGLSSITLRNIKEVNGFSPVQFIMTDLQCTRATSLQHWCRKQVGCPSIMYASQRTRLRCSFVSDMTLYVANLGCLGFAEAQQAVAALVRYPCGS